MKILVCGGCDFENRDHMFRALDALHSARPVTHLIHGGARGADRLGGEWAAAAGIPVTCFDAKWDAHGAAAGPIRNQAMIDEGHPDLVVAFRGGRGTADMV